MQHRAASRRLCHAATERGVHLERGEAFFEVAKDPHRPFVVHAGPVSVTAVGTQFSVRRRGTDTLVVVTEGVVRVGNSAASGVSDAQAVKAGEVARIADTGVLVQNKTIPETEEQLSWRKGMLIFHDTRLSEAIAEFNRYNTRKIVIADPALNDFRVAGSFKAASTTTFVHLLAQGFPVRVEERADELILSPQ